MRKIAHVFKHSLLSEPHLWIAVLSAIAFFVMELLHLGHWPPGLDSVRGVVHIVMVCILAIAVDRLKEGDATRHNTDRIRRLGECAGAVCDGGREFVRDEHLI